MKKPCYLNNSIEIAILNTIFQQSTKCFRQSKSLSHNQSFIQAHQYPKLNSLLISSYQNQYSLIVYIYFRYQYTNYSIMFEEAANSQAGVSRRSERRTKKINKDQFLQAYQQRNAMRKQRRSFYQNDNKVGSSRSLTSIQQRCRQMITIRGGSNLQQMLIAMDEALNQQRVKLDSLFAIKLSWGQEPVITCINKNLMERVLVGVSGVTSSPAEAPKYSLVASTTEQMQHFFVQQFDSESQLLHPILKKQTSYRLLCDNYEIDELGNEMMPMHVEQDQQQERQ